MNPISIHNADAQIQLQATSYHIGVLGGFNVQANSFRLKLIHMETGKIIKPTRTRWPHQSYAFGKKSKRYFSIKVPSNGLYSIVFINPESLIVKRSNLFFSSMLTDPIPNEEIAIHFYRSF